MSNERPPTRRARQQLRRRRREQVAGAVVVVVGVVVAVIAVVALQQPGGRNRTNGSGSPTVTLTKVPGSGSASPSTSQSGTRGSSRTTSSGTTSSEATSSKTTAELRQTPLVVLNNTTISGLARSAADSFTSGGWTVTRYGNYQNNILSTCAYYDPDTADAQAAATALREQFPGIQRVEPKFDGLPEGPIVVVLTSDYSNN